jgi:deaminated glutathione amidase
MTVLVVATCQFPVGDDTDRNLSWIKRQMTRAARRGARVAHFPEGTLSGYAGTDFTTFAGFDWNRLDQAAEELREHARSLGVLCGRQ